MIPEDEVRLWVMADGAPWIWKQTQALFPSTVEMLDDYYGSAQVYKVAALPYGADPRRQREWCEANVERFLG